MIIPFKLAWYGFMGVVVIDAVWAAITLQIIQSVVCIVLFMLMLRWTRYVKDRF